MAGRHRQANYVYDQDDVEVVSADYLDIDEILSKTETISCIFSTELAEVFYTHVLGVPRPSLTMDGYCAEAPLWVVNSVRNQCTITLPKQFHPTMQGILNANAEIHDFSRSSQNFYTTGMDLCQLLKYDDEQSAFELSKCLLNVMTQRLPKLITNAAYGQKGYDKLSLTEKKLFNKARECREDTDSWFKANSNNAIKSRKRKFDTLEH